MAQRISWKKALVYLSLPMALVVGAMSFRRLFPGCKVLESTYVLQSIRSAEESFRAENLGYVDVSRSGSYVPQNVAACTSSFPKHSIRWGASVADFEQWEQLGLTFDGGLRYGYRVRAGDAGAIPPQPDGCDISSWPSKPLREVWYVAEACGFSEQDHQTEHIVATSFSGEFFYCAH